MTCNPNLDFAHLNDRLPPRLERLMAAGELGRASRLARVMLEGGVAPELAPALRVALVRMARVPQEYRVTREEAIARLAAEAPGFGAEQLDALVDAGRIDFRYVDGQMRFLPSWLDSLRIYAAEVPGLAPAPATGVPEREAMLARLHRDGAMALEVTLHARLEVPDAPAGSRVRAWLPVPAACEQQDRIEVLEATLGAHLAPADAPQRTASWDVRARGACTFDVTYRYRSVATYLSPEDLAQGRVPQARTRLLGAGRGVDPALCLGEHEPHVVFTPRLRRLAARVTAGCDTPLERARAIYRWVTGSVDYRFQPPYLLLDGIADMSASSLRADCGMFALLFITLCRIAGVPAHWQSGLSVKPTGVGCHDWAMFYAEPWGWLWADCSFGSSARREGDDARREHYFGNLDPWRMVANSREFAPFEPDDEALREDPFDNQLGEASVDGVGLSAHQMRRSVELVDMADCDAFATD
ncbi:MAG: transglutaminase-like domain-containing protein [Parafannyhessea sp.]|uniref:transglutaminase-like domain-containing protein n=1 Tax=Parafannyhessea sp. TaxID=2847324 RepID=UPI003F10F030